MDRVVLPNTIMEQAAQAQAAVVAAATAVGARGPFSPVRTVIDMPQPVMPTQSNFFYNYLLPSHFLNQKNRSN